MRRIALGAAVLGLILFGPARPSPAEESIVAGSTEIPSTAPSRGPSTSASPTPTYQPGPDSSGGRVVRRVPNGVVIDSAGREIPVDLASIVDVWRETSVPASAIEVNDDVFLNGTQSGDGFVARYAWVNIGRLDGVIRAVDGNDIVVLAAVRSDQGFATRELHVELSPHLDVVRVAQGAIVPGSRADLTVGREVGMVLYRPRNATPRATRIWLSLGP